VRRKQRDVLANPPLGMARAKPLDVSAKPPDGIARRAQPDMAISSCKNGDHSLAPFQWHNADVKTFYPNFLPLKCGETE